MLSTTNQAERLARQYGAQYHYACNGFTRPGWHQQVQLKQQPWPAAVGATWHSLRGDTWEHHGEDLIAAMERAFGK